MKKVMIWSIVGLVIVVAIVAACVVGGGHRGWHGHRWGHFGPAAYLSHELNLSDAQKEQIKTMWQVERPTIARLVREVAAEVAAGLGGDVAFGGGGDGEGFGREILA